MKKRLMNLGLAALMTTALTLTAAGAWTQPAADYEPVPCDVDMSGDYFVYDMAGLLSEDELYELENMAYGVADNYGCGLFIVTVDDYMDFNMGSDIEDMADMAYGQMDLGVSDDRSGCMLMLSMANRDYALVADGYGNVAFTDYGKEYLAEAFLDDFGNNDWYSGFVDFMRTGEEMLESAVNGEPVDVGSASGGSRAMGVVLCILIGLVIALIVRGVLHGQMKSVAVAEQAKFYVKKGGTDMNVVQDLYTHTTQSRVYDPPQKDSGGSGGTTIRSSGRSTSSGKF